MRTWITSACVVLAWSIILPAILMTAGGTGSVHPAQASTRTDRQTEITLTRTLRTDAAPVTATSPTTRYVVQRGDTLSSIAARFAVRGGWPALYAANRPLIGPHPDLLHSGTALVLPGVAAPVRYKVAAGDTLAGIAAGLAVRGGWPALYAANRQAIGPDPDAIHPGIVLTVPRPAAPSLPTPGLPRQRQHPVPPPPPAGTRHHPRPAAKGAPKATGMPPWLTNLLLAVGLLILAAFLAELVLVLRRRRQQAAAQAIARAVQVRKAQPGQGTGARPGPQKAHIVLADHERLVVTRDERDDTVYVLRPPGEDPMAILRVARLVLPEGPYGELAKQLRVPASWPMEERKELPGG
jgi:LysM domain